MHKTFSSLSILALFAATACIIEDTSDDDDGASASNSASNSNSDSGTQGGNETSAADSTSAATGDSTTAPADSSGGSGTGGSGMCGWGPLKGQMNVTDGYSCSGSGEDPRNVFPIECPTDVALEVGGDCGGDMGVTGVGCCDGNTNWYCADNGSGPVLFSDPC